MELKTATSFSIQQVPVQRIKKNTCISVTDTLSVEEPLEISIDYGPAIARVQKNISVTMRTPGNDHDLAVGFLFTEGILSSYEQIEAVVHRSMNCRAGNQNIVQVQLQKDFMPQLMQIDRNFYTTSSCGVCGKGSIASIRTASPYTTLKKSPLEVSLEAIYQLPEKLSMAQEAFSATGGIHASGLFTAEGNLLFLKEDVGRHNALDKLIGFALCNQMLPLSRHILLLSGRASFELVQKAAMAGIPFIAAIGAPSSLAVALAKEFDITLLGFLKQEKFNIYHLSTHTQILHLPDEN